MAVISTLATGLVLLFLAGSVPLSRFLATLLPAGIAAFLVIGMGFLLIRTAAQGVLSMTCRNAIGKWFDHQRGLRSEEHTSELQSLVNLVCRLLLEKKNLPHIYVRRAAHENLQ